MKRHKIKFVRHGILFIVIFLIGLLVVNQFYLKLVQEKKVIYRKEIMYYDFIDGLENKEIDYIFFGDSRTEDALNPQQINNSFNYAMGSEDYIETYYKLKRIVEKDNVKVNNIILQVSLHTFSDKIRKPNNLFKDVELFSRFVPMEEISELREQPIMQLVIKSNLPFIGNGNDIFNRIKNPSPKPLELGWHKNTDNLSLKNKTKASNKRYSRHFNKDRKMIEEKSFKYFLKLLEFAEDNQINIIFINYPVSKEYADLVIEKGIVREDYYADVFEQVNQTLSEDYVLLDYYDLYFEHPDYFGDVDHLNYVGSEMFSRQVVSHLQSPLQLQQVYDLVS